MHTDFNVFELILILIWYIFILKNNNSYTNERSPGEFYSSGYSIELILESVCRRGLYQNLNQFWLIAGIY